MHREELIHRVLKNLHYRETDVQYSLEQITLGSTEKRMRTSIRKSISESQATDINSINSSLKENKYFYKEVIDLNVTMDQEFTLKTHIFGQNTEADKLE